MNYIIIADSEYTYEPHILCRELLKACIHLNPESANKRLITILIRMEVESLNKSKHWWFYKDIRFRDLDFTAERISQLTNIPMDSLKKLKFSKIEAIEAKEILDEHPQNLVYNIKYNIEFDSNETIPLNLLVHNTDLRSFLEMAKYYSQSHQVEPVLFHNLKRIDESNYHRLTEIFDTSKEFGLNKFFIPKSHRFSSKMPYSTSEIDGFKSSSKYSLYTIDRKIK